MSINDLVATILAMLGVDREYQTYRLIRRNFRLTDVAGTVVKEIIA